MMHKKIGLLVPHRYIIALDLGSVTKSIDQFRFTVCSVEVPIDRRRWSRSET